MFVPRWLAIAWAVSPLGVVGLVVVALCFLATVASLVATVL